MFPFDYVFMVNCWIGLDKGVHLTLVITEVAKSRGNFIWTFDETPNNKTLQIIKHYKVSKAQHLSSIWRYVMSLAGDQVAEI